MDHRTPDLAAREQLHRIARRAMLARGLEPDFPADALAQLDAIHHAPAAPRDTRDLRALAWCSIDNDDSRDLDQLSVADRVDGGTKLLVAIADVDALVPRGTPIDDHARTNTTSVYTAARVFPMLPEKLSTDLTSLNEGVERLAIVTEMVVDADGLVTASDIYRARVVNRAKLAYDRVAAWLDGDAPVPPGVAAVPGLDDNLRLQERAARALRRQRHEHGALSLETVQARPVFDGDALADLRGDRGNRAKELIEDLMVAANGVSARFLAARNFPSLRRVLRSPERWQRIVDLANELGAKLPATADARALEGFLEARRAAAPERFAELSLAVIKLLGRGEYAVVQGAGRSDGHFGLAVRDYTHSTAPNRRYPDVITQRLLKAALAGGPVPYSADDLRALAARCTAQEDNATKVERQVRKSAAALLLAGRVGERFDAFVSGASDKGTWVHVDHPAAEGKLVRGEHGLDVGDRVRVELVSVDVERGFVDFVRVAHA
nr:RNB domain-containing ribonuclease [Kofleriaceae bacterium]